MDDGKTDHRMSANGGVALGMVNLRDAGEQADADGDAVLHVDNSGHSDGVVKIAEPWVIKADVNQTSGEATAVKVPSVADACDDGHGPDDAVSDVGGDGATAVKVPSMADACDDGHGLDDAVNNVGNGKATDVKIPGLVNGGADGGQHGPRDASDVTGQGTFSGHNVKPQSPGVDIFGNVVNNAVASGWTGEQLDQVIRRDATVNGEVTHRANGQKNLGVVGDRQGPSNGLDGGQRAGTRGNRDDNRASGGADIMLFKQHQWPRSYDGGPTVRDWSRRYTCDPTNVSDWSQRYKRVRYKSDRTNGDGPKTYTFGHDRDDDDVTRRPQASTRFRQAEFFRQPSTDAGQAVKKSTT